MTNHAVADELFTGEFKAIRAAYREGEGNATIRAACQREVGVRCSFPFLSSLFLLPLLLKLFLIAGIGGGGVALRSEQFRCLSFIKSPRLLDRFKPGRG